MWITSRCDGVLWRRRGEHGDALLGGFVHMRSFYLLLAKALVDMLLTTSKQSIMV